MALLAKQGSESAAVTYAAATAGAGGDTYLNSGKERVHVRNAGVGACVVTIARTKPCDTGAVLHPKTVTVPAGGDRTIGPLSPAEFNDASNLVKVTYDQVTTVTVAVI